MNGKEYKTYFSLALCAFFWGGAFVAAKYVVQELAPVVAASIRFILATIVLVPVLIMKEGRNSLVSLKQIPILAAAGLTGIFLYNLFFFKGLQSTSAISGSLLVAAGPTITAFLAWIILREALHFNQIIGIAVSFLGVIIIITKGSVVALRTLTFNAGDLYIFMGVISWSLYTICGKVATKHMSPLLTTTYACGLGGIFLTAMALPDLNFQTILDLSYASHISLVFLAVCASAIAFLLWYDGVNKVGANRASTFQNIVPLSSSLLSILLLGEKLYFYHGVGALTILVGVYWANNKNFSFSKLRAAATIIK